MVLIKGAGEMASAIAWRLYMANIRQVCLIDLPDPLCVRRTVAFCPALQSGASVVEGVGALATRNRADILAAWRQQKLAVMLATDWARVADFAPDIMVDAVLAKRNLGTDRDAARVVIALGPGFEAGKDCHVVIETNRGHDLGRIITVGSAAPNTGVPGSIAGYSAERVLRTPTGGLFETDRAIAEQVHKGDIVGRVAGHPVEARIDGVLRGLIRPGTNVPAGLKVGDIDPRGRPDYCTTISDKARAISGSVLECVMRRCNDPTAWTEC
ncbi:MAG: EF2563 family selenium-dependent molybdenum hydroxylase system protein [Alphaproteobacteria bacterium]|nr:EF2563 family selenium-dependent molybdenum hydroxylase system protein [Alphaproteobacteria bacterium]